MTSKESPNKSAEQALPMALLEETIDFGDEEEQQQQHFADNAMVTKEGGKTSPLTKPPAPQHRKNNSQVSQQTIRHRNSSKKKAFSGQVAARLEQAVAQASTKPVNRSADLVPLTHEYDKQKRRLRALITASKQYHESMGRMYRARMEVVVRLATVATSTPLHEKIGSNGNGKAMSSGSNHDLRDAGINVNDNGTMNSLLSIHKLAYKHCRFDVLEYQETVVAYLVEWERVITTRVDNGLDQVFELNAKMNHYQTKVGVLRKKMHQIEKNRSRGGAQSNRSTSSSVSTSTSMSMSSNPFLTSTIPVKMETKLQRNQEKLEEAWKAHEAAASTLCHLLEQVTRQGWKDLAPLVECMMEFESSRTSHDSDAFESRLETLQHDLNELVRQLEEFDSSHEKKTEPRRPQLLSAPALEVPIMLTSSDDNGVESDDGFDDEDEDSRDSEDSDSSVCPLEGETASTSETSTSSTSISSRANNSPNKSSSNASSNNIKSIESSSKTGFGVRSPPTRITAV